MPSARPSGFSGGGGLLRGVDATIVGLEFITRTSEGKPAQAAKAGQAAKPAKPPFTSLQAQLTVLPDGATEVVKPFPLFVGDAAAYTFDGPTVSGEKQFSKSSGFPMFVQSLVDAKFPEDLLPEDPEGLVADYTNVIGARVRFDWRKNEKLTASAGKTYGKDDRAAIKAGKPPKGSGFDREDLIVTAYYGQAEVAPVKGAAKTGTKAGKVNAAKAIVDIATLAGDTVLTAVSKAKDQRITKTRLSVKILTLLASADPDVRNEAIEWAGSDTNLAGIEGVDYDTANQTLSLSADA